MGLVRLDVPPAQALQTIFLWFGRVLFEVTCHVPDSVPVREGSDESVTLSIVLMLHMVLDLTSVQTLALSATCLARVVSLAVNVTSVQFIRVFAQVESLLGTRLRVLTLGLNCHQVTIDTPPSDLEHEEED